MKLSEEMDVDNGSTPAEATKNTKPSELTCDKSLKPLSPSQNGTKFVAANVTNGNAALDVNLEENAIGFEVESYGDFNASMSTSNHSGPKADLEGSELNGDNHTSSIDDYADTNKIFSDESCTESTHNSSHMSEEFQLRLSDDESSQLSETVSSSTPFKLSADSTKGEDEEGPSLAGSKSIESTIIATGPLVKTSADPEPKKVSEIDAQPLVCSGDKKLETSNKDTDVEPKTSVETEDKISKCHSLSPEVFGIHKEGDQSVPSCQTEKCAQLSSLEDKLEAELEAELQAEIAAEMENKEVTESEINDSVFYVCTATCSDKDSVSSSSIQEKSDTTASKHDEINLLDGKGPSCNITEPGKGLITVIKSEKEDDGDIVSIKEEVPIKTEEMSLDCGDLPMKNETKPLDCKSEADLVKREHFTLKCEGSPCKSEFFPLKSEECPPKGEECPSKSEECPLESEGNSGENGESINVENDSSMTPDQGDITQIPCDDSSKNLNRCEDFSIMDSQKNNEGEKLVTISIEQASTQVDTEDAVEPAKEQNKVIESGTCEVEPLTAISSEQLETPLSSKLHDKPASLSEPNSPFSDDSEGQMSEFHAESDGACDTGDGILNENDSDTMGESSNFCDSTVLDASCTDDMVSRDSSISASENITKGFRKRILSHSDDDSSDTFRIKKLNGLSETVENSDNLKSHDIGHKRPAEVTPELDSKKQRISNDVGDKELNDSASKTESPKQVLQEKLQAPTEKNVEHLTFKSVKDFEKTGDLKSVERESPLTDLPFLRKLHKKQLSKMSRTDLEELILQKMCEAITERSVIGELRLRCQTLENRQEKENEKFQKLKKQMNELTIVMKKYLDNQRLNKPTPPIKVTRSVGLQVSLAVRPCSSACFSSIRTRGGQQTPQAVNQNWPAKQGTVPSKPDSSLPDTSSQVLQAKPMTPIKVNRSPSYTSRPAINGVSSTVPPALVPTGSSNAPVLLMPGRSTGTSPQVPPLQQITTVRPRFSMPSSTASTSPQSVIPVQPKPSPVRHSSPQSTSQLKAARSNDVEVIDIESEDHNKRPAQQHQHQQKQAANAAAQSLAGNSGMTVRLISPTQTIPMGYSNFLVPTQGNTPQKMIIASSPPGNGVRGNFVGKFVMKSNQGNVIIPLQSNGAAVSSSVVQLPTSAAAVQQIFTNAGKRTNSVAPGRLTSLGHPAPLPVGPTLQAQNPAWKQIPPRPNLKIQHQNNGIVLSWNMTLGSQYAEIESYQLFAYQESTAPPSAGLWKKVGDVKALPLPMACTLTQFVEGHKYHFTVRAVDKHGRVGHFSQQGSIRLEN